MKKLFLFASLLILFSFSNINLAGLQLEVRPLTDGTLRRIRVPILMYHYVSPLPPDADDIRIELTLEPQIFRDHMEYLKAGGYSSISLYELDSALLTGAPLPEKPVILTFDDGYIDHYQYVFPTLKEYGFKGTFFIITDYADHNETRYLSWQQIVEMSNAGMSMEAHTKSHIDLRNRSRDLLIYQIMGSIESLNAHTGLQSHMLAYPGGKYDNAVLELVGELPVWRALTTVNNPYHTSDNLLEVSRLRVTGNMSIGGLASILEHG